MLRGQDGVVEQARRQLEDLVRLPLFSASFFLLTHTGLLQVPVWAVLDYTNTHCIERELLLAKVSILGPEYIEDQFIGGPTHEPRRHHRRDAELDHEASKLEREVQLAHNFEKGGHPEQDNSGPPPLTPNEALRLKSDNLNSINVLASQFGGRIVDVSEHSVIVELCGKTKRVEAFLSLLKPFGLLESARTGKSRKSNYRPRYSMSSLRFDGHASYPNPFRR